MSGDSAPKAKRVKLDAMPAVDANECITFHLLKREGDQVAVDEDGHFNPEMTHQ
jgi:hypothetical protein